MTSQCSLQFDQSNTTTEPEEKQSFLMELCKKVIRSSEYELQLDELMETIKEQPQSKSSLMELFQTIRNIDNNVCIEYAVMD
jgi:hypothetical protein